MKKTALLGFLMVLIAGTASAQQVESLFKSSGPSGGYGAISNKFTSINGEYANLVEVYGGWFIKRKFLLGLGASALTNDIRVPDEYSSFPLQKLSWQYGQFGLMTEYVFWSNRIVHANLTMFSGAGFTLQYQRHTNEGYHDWDYENDVHDESFFYVMEPGAQVEINLFKWLRLSPGVSYRKTFGADGVGIGDKALSDWSYNITLKAGKF